MAWLGCAQGRARQTSCQSLATVSNVLSADSFAAGRLTRFTAEGSEPAARLRFASSRASRHSREKPSDKRQAPACAAFPSNGKPGASIALRLARRADEAPTIRQFVRRRSAFALRPFVSVKAMLVSWKLTDPMP